MKKVIKNILGIKPKIVEKEVPIEVLTSKMYSWINSCNTVYQLMHVEEMLDLWVRPREYGKEAADFLQREIHVKMILLSVFSKEIETDEQL